MSADTPKSKSRWCEQCHCRHDVNHEHFKKTPRDRTADTVTGSKSATDLGQKAADGKTSTLQSKLAQQKFQADQDSLLREACERRWSRRMRWIYGVWAKITDDPSMKLSDEEEKDFGQVHADFSMAWGIAASNKLESIFDVGTMHLTVIAARSKWVEELMKKKEQPEELPVDDPRRVPTRPH